jgi:Lysylphosphatidylglycerol synthase TM region
VPLDGQRRGRNLAGLVAAVLGLALFAWFVQRIGPAEIWQGLRDVGWGLVLIVAIAGFRFALRAVAWITCLEPPHVMPFRAAFAAVLAGDSLGNLTPLGLFASEPAKAAFVRGRLPLGAAITALAIENILYTLSAVAMIAVSTGALLVEFDLPPAVRTAGSIAIALIVVIFIVTAWLIWRRPALVSWMASFVVPKNSKLQKRIAHVRDLEERIYAFARQRPDALVPALAAEAGFHALGVVEVYVTWWLMQGNPPSLLTAFILEGALRLIVVVFKFVPLQLGVAEWTTGSFTQLLGYGAATGGTLSIVRKVRTVFWVLVGTILLVRRGVARSG